MHYNLCVPDGVIVGSSSTLVVAPDYLGSVYPRGWKVIKTDNRTGLWDVAMDIEQHKLDLEAIQKVVLLLGRDDLLQSRWWEVVLERLDRATAGRQVMMYCSGPVPRIHDGRSMFNDQRQARADIKQLIDRGLKWFKFFPAAEVLDDGFQVIKQLLDERGLTCDGREQFWATCPI